MSDLLFIFVAAWLPGTEGGGIADVLFRDNLGEVNVDFAGRLSFSWPMTSSQTPLNRNDPNYEPLFTYGFGLTYGIVDTLPDDLPESDNPASKSKDTGAPRQ